jgi:hypothetical protein
VTTVCPSLPELVTAVREHLEREIQPALSGPAAFHARVAINVLAIIERELELAPIAHEGELQRLRALLGEDGDREALNRELCRRLRAGDLDYRDSTLLAHLRQTTIDRIGIDNPRYATYQKWLSE